MQRLNYVKRERCEQWTIDGARVPRKPIMRGYLPRDSKLEDPQVRAHYQQRIADELVPGTIVHPDLRERQAWMTSMADLRGTWGWGLLLWPRYQNTDFDTFVGLVLDHLDGPCQIGWCRGGYETFGATLLLGFRVPTNMEMTYV